MFNALDFARNMIQNNQNNIPNTPWAQAAVQAIMNGDVNAGQQIANNLCNSFGTPKQQVINMARQKFPNLPF